MPVGITMIKPIVYHNIEEKELLEKEMMASVPEKKREKVSRALMKIFYRPSKKVAKAKSKSNR
jgi:hypothetical protein